MKKVILFLIMLITVVFITISCSSNRNEVGELAHNESGAEGIGNEQGESGKRWGINVTANEVINGVRVIIKFNVTTNAFEGTFENLNSNIAQQTRLEVHIFDANGNSTEFGPTLGVDMQPGETRSVSLSITAGVNFVEFTMHPEIGVAGSGG